MSDRHNSALEPQTAPTVNLAMPAPVGGIPSSAQAAAQPVNPLMQTAQTAQTVQTVQIVPMAMPTSVTSEQRVAPPPHFVVPMSPPPSLPPPSSPHTDSVSGSSMQKAFSKGNDFMSRSSQVTDGLVGTVNDKTEALLNKFNKPDEVPVGTTCVDVIAKLKNMELLLYSPRRFNNFRWANSLREHVVAGQSFANAQFTQLYGRISAKYNYHKLQQYENLVRRFNVSDDLRTHIKSGGGTHMFYKLVCGHDDSANAKSFPADLTPLSDLSTVAAAANLVYNEVLRYKQDTDNPAASADMARQCYVRGFSRLVRAADKEDWKALRAELRNSQHLADGMTTFHEQGVTNIAISYKAKEVKITRRMVVVDEEGNETDDEGLLARETIDLTEDFVDDFRWEQLIRSCQQIAKVKGTPHVRIWVDRLVMYGFDREEKKRRYSLVGWPDFGLLAYAVCPVVRLYDTNEIYFGTDFWRKLETIMGVAGHGIYVDDYMLRQYDTTIFYSRNIYKRLEVGICRIGGQGKYLRSVSLALATALLTDGVAVREANEHPLTRGAVPRWKAWALRTLAEGAYSNEHPSMMRDDDRLRATVDGTRKVGPFQIGLREFQTLLFWETYVSNTTWLEGESYLDMSIQRSNEWRKGGAWDGVVEWTGMISGACEVTERAQIMNYMNSCCTSQMWTSTSGHVATLLSATDMDRRPAGFRRRENLALKRTLVINLARYSSSRDAHVTAVAEATGLWGDRVLPWYLYHLPNPDKDQIPEIKQDGVAFHYEAMQVAFGCPLSRRWSFIILLCVLVPFFWPLVFIVLLAAFLVIVSKNCIFCWPWPWHDHCDVGEAVFDNVLMHGLLESGIKTEQYRQLEVVRYDQMNWT